MRIAFFIPEFKPGACGVSDYSSRMISLLEDAGHQCILLCLNFPEISGEIPAHAVAGFLDHGVDGYDLVAVQYTPNGWLSLLKVMWRLRQRRNTNLLWMIHECWYHTTPDFSISTRQKMVACRQKGTAWLFKLLTRPDHSATSNPYYQKILGELAIKCVLSPMPATIPPADPGTQPPPAELPEWMGPHPDGNLWVTFGSIYTTYWNCEEAFLRFAESEAITGRKNHFVICGKQTEEDRNRFMDAAGKSGCAGRVWFTGPVSVATINWWLARADASFAATGFAYWEKSTGVLAAVERGIPLFFVRGLDKQGVDVEFLGIFHADPVSTLSSSRSSFMGRPSRHMPAEVLTNFTSSFLTPAKNASSP